MDEVLQRRLREVSQSPEEHLERAALLARAGHGEQAGPLVLDTLQKKVSPQALLEGLAPSGASAFETSMVGERFERPRLGPLAFDASAESVYCAMDRTQFVHVSLRAGAWSTRAETPRPIRSIACAQEPILSYGELEQPVVKLHEGALRRLPGPQRKADRDLYAGILPGAYIVRSARGLKAYPEAGSKRATWSVSGDVGEGTVAASPAGAVAVRGDELWFYDLGARRPSQTPLVARSLRDSARYGGNRYGTFQVRRAGQGAQVLFAMARKEHKHGLAWIDSSGEVLARVELPYGPWRWAESPSGQHALVLAQEVGRAGPNQYRTHQAFLVDLAAEEVRELTLPALPGGLGWSWTGRSFGISTQEGTLLLGRADAPPELEPPPGPGLAGWRELFLAERQRFWRVRREGGTLQLHYGAQGAAGARRTREFESEELATKDLERRIRRKLREGYAEAAPRQD